MDKHYLEHFFERTGKLKGYEVANFTLPLTLIYKNMFNETEHLLKTKFNMIHSELDVLAALYFNGKVLSPTELYAATVFSSGGMTKVLKKLEASGLISRVPCAKDKRSTLVKIEKQGEELVEDSLQEVLQTRKPMFDILSHKEQEDLKKILKKLTLHLSDK
ncbi:MarR family winged helix-turn-helix transcriptional regulator [Candidatus Marinarcus aquaticus]|uniref:MarR family transcriptional regulator n=1 Tax=Candidatus Marinarcus aquaticus TaxID=2044504 RepID=A0A4V1LNN1_9BACT|nr:MarR family transcriptional regulator [Candidatus Marinarcus aquaticus]RXJ54436.1 MarR family transcriptional regulator [Candidatus Marinarcus aquaticus]